MNEVYRALGKQMGDLYYMLSVLVVSALTVAFVAGVAAFGLLTASHVILWTRGQ